jgi:hypothetical protein
MTRRIRLRDRLVALEHGVVAGGGGGSTGGGSGGGGSTGGGSSSGGASSGEVGIVLPIEAESVFAIDTLPAGDEFEITLDGVLTSPDPPSPVGYISWSKGAGIANDGRHMVMINASGDGHVASDSGFPYNTDPITQEEFIALPKTGAGAYMEWQGQTPKGYYVVEYHSAGAPGGWPSITNATALPGADALAKWNSLLTAHNFKPWADFAHPELALAAAPKNIYLCPNGVSQDTQGVVGGTDGGAPEQASVSDAGLLLARAWTGADWRVLSKGHLSRKTGVKRILSAQCAAVQGPSKRTFNAASSWEDTDTPIESLYLDFDGADFTGTVSVVPKTVVTA